MIRAQAPQAAPQAQQQQQQQAGCPPAATLPKLAPGNFNVCIPGHPAPRLPLPPEAQAAHQKNVAILDELFRAVGNSTNPAAISAAIQHVQSAHPGQVHCPTGAISPGQCFVTSGPSGAAAGAAAPNNNNNNISPPDVAP